MASTMKYTCSIGITIAFFTLAMLPDNINGQVKKAKANISQKAFIKSIKNACVIIHDMDDKRLRFNNGYYNQRNDDSLTSSEAKFIDPIIITRFSFDTSTYAIATIGFSGGGSGYWHYILLFKDKNDKAIQLGSEPIMDSTGHGIFKRVKVKGDSAYVYVDDIPPVVNRFLIRSDSLLNLGWK